MNTSRSDLAALALLTKKPRKKESVGKKIRMYTPESDFMEEVEVVTGSPQHRKLLKQAAQMEPDGPEARYIVEHGIK